MDGGISLNAAIHGSEMSLQTLTIFFLGMVTSFWQPQSSKDLLFVPLKTGTSPLLMSSQERKAKVCSVNVTSLDLPHTQR